MFSRSLTTKILIAVGLTVAAVIAIYTYFVIRIQSTWWHERTEAQNMISATMVHEYLNGVMLSDRHEEVQNFLQQMKASQEIERGRLIKPDGTVVFSTDTQEVNRVTVQVPPQLFTEQMVLRSERRENGRAVALVLRPVTSTPNCQRCHGKTEVIGAIMLEKSLRPAEASIATNRNLLIAYGVVIFVLVGVVLWLLIVRLVTQPVGTVLQQMNRVQTGDLSSRVEPGSDDEMGKLAHGFNAMVGSLQKTTAELQESHEKQMQQAGKLASIGELASGIAHEIRNPLAGIGAAVEILAENSSGNGQYREVVSEIHRQIHRLNTTLRDLLDFARQREPEIAPCSLADVIRPMLALIRPDAQKHHIAIVENYAPEMPPLCVDLPQCQQAVLNILLNAIQSMPHGGTATLGAVAADNAVRITISDTGVGIPPENLQRIFVPFFTTKHRGTGLGLAITRSIVEKHGGKITVASRLGEGTTFTLEFAAHQENLNGEDESSDH